jgi:hypothetical protein
MARLVCAPTFAFGERYARRLARGRAAGLVLAGGASERNSI